MAKKPVADAELPHADAEMPVADAEMPVADAEVPIEGFLRVPHGGPIDASDWHPRWRAGEVHDCPVFPAHGLAAGHRARRLSWAPGFELSVEAARGRSGGSTRFMTSGGRGGLLEWAPKNLADEILATDWQVIIAYTELPPADPDPADPADPEAADPADPDPDLLAGA